ncbi:VOC family protein [Kineococcus terrestris]|uniref:VOC family protein n=1 Tax=Kineococcus terrestris TaxID=2044856 RepID=UPI0034DB773F
MAHTLNPYLTFRGTAREALDAYRDVLGGELDVMTFAEGGMPVDVAEEADWLMHGQLTLPDGKVLMASDAPTGMPAPPMAGFAVALTTADADEVDTVLGWYRRLAEGGREDVPLAVAPWGDWFGQCTDRFGTPWMVDAGPVDAQERPADREPAQSAATP